MSALSIQVPFPVFQDRDGQPLDNGYVWIGQANLNPQTNPVVAYYDTAMTIVAAQPLRTINGYISRAGTPAQIYVDGANFSILVQDSKGSMVYNFPNGTGISPDACGVTYNPPFTGSVPYPVCEKLEQTVSVQDFGAVGNGSTNDTVAFTAAISYCAANNLCLYVPSVSSYYNIATNITVSCKFSAGNYRVFGGAGTISFNANTTEVVYSAWFNNDTPASTIFATGNVPNWVKLDTGVEHKIKDDAPAATTYQTRTFVSGAGFLNQDKGVGAYRIDVADSAAVLADPTKAGVLYGIVMTIDPVVSRSNIPYDDATGLLIQNGGTQKATDAIYIGDGSPLTVQWNAILSCDASSSVGISLNAYCETYGIDLAFGSYGYGAMRIPNASAFLARNGANNDDVPLFRLDSSNTLKFGSASWAINLAPFTDNTQSMGIATNRWSVIYAGTGTINTSDATQKQDVADLTVAEQAVAKSIKGLIKTFRFKDAVAQKGDDARTHVGVMAQDVAAAFAEQGLDANKYGMFCADTYIDEDGTEQTVYGVRYEELLAFVISAL